jgi:hypothetical protein
MLCQQCQQRFDCIPAALAANDSYMYALLERLKQCDRYREETSTPQARPQSSQALAQPSA